jgi:hypothetical protein
MKPKALCVYIVTMVFAISHLHAQTAPTTSRIEIPADQSTPRGALNVLALAMDAGDEAKIRAVLQPANVQEAQVVDSLVGLHDAIARFGKAVIDAFGEAEARKLVGDKSTAQAQLVEEIRAMSEEVKGDTATIAGPDKSTQFHLTRVDGRWMIPVGPWLGADSQQKLQEITQDKQRRAAIFSAMAKEVNADTYKSVDEIAEALQLKLMKAAMDRSGITTEPATKPAAPEIPS